MEATMTSITWLHLSDWHQKGDDFDRTVVRDALIKDIRDRVKRIDPRLAQIDFVVFSGDVTQSGCTDEYKAAQVHLFDRVLKTAGTPRRRLFIIPGNHDLDWQALEHLPADLLKPLESDAQTQPWLTDAEKRAKLLEPFKAYTQFVTDYTGQPKR
jgi:DNA repair exonuclease SbcCD nuclease subunit